MERDMEIVMQKVILKSTVDPVVIFFDDEKNIQDYYHEEKRIMHELSSVISCFSCVKVSYENFILVLSKSLRNNGYQLSHFTIENKKLVANYHDDFTDAKSVVNELLTYCINYNITLEY